MKMTNLLKLSLSLTAGLSVLLLTGSVVMAAGVAATWWLCL